MENRRKFYGLDRNGNPKPNPQNWSNDTFDDRYNHINDVLKVHSIMDDEDLKFIIKNAFISRIYISVEAEVILSKKKLNSLQSLYDQLKRDGVLDLQDGRYGPNLSPYFDICKLGDKGLGISIEHVVPGDVYKKAALTSFSKSDFKSIFDNAYICLVTSKEAKVRPNENIERRTINNLFNPAYRLDEDCLIVNASGPAEPRIFDADFGSAFFEDGYAFSLEGFTDYGWLINELNETYVRRQLHPYGQNNMVPEPVTEEDYLNLILYKEVGEDEDFDLSELNDMGLDESDTFELPEEGADALPAGFELKDGNKKYTILNYISHGAFGYTYRAEMLNCSNGSKEIVAIKEFYPTGVLDCCRVNNQVCYDKDFEEQFENFKRMFRSEPDFILSMADTPDNHVTEVKSIFESEVTGTIYYVMKFYAGESLDDMIKSDQVPTSEKLIIGKIVLPICKALNAMHGRRILHLDIKPENIVIDENGEAVLIDFGVAQQYDENGKLISLRDTHSTSAFSAPENSDGNMRYFGPQADIFGAAATLFTLVSGKWPHPINDSQDRERAFELMNCSEGMKQAIAEGMSLYSNDRPANAQLFLNLFPGCEDIKLD